MDMINIKVGVPGNQIIQDSEKIKRDIIKDIKIVIRFSVHRMLVKCYHFCFESHLFLFISEHFTDINDISNM